MTRSHRNNHTSLPPGKSPCSVSTEAEFDRATPMLLASDLKANVPDTPTLADAKQVTDLLHDRVSDFPDSSDFGRSVWISAFCALAARPAINRPVPLYMVTATTPRSGKSNFFRLGSELLNPPTRGGKK